MSVHVRKRARGRVVYEVVWRDPDRRQRCETFWTKRDAEARDREIRDLRQRGRHEAIDAGSESLAETTERWWVDHVESSLSQSTAVVYASALDGHLLPRLGTVPIRDLQPADVVALRRELRADGVGEAMTQKTPGRAVGHHAAQPAARAHPRPTRWGQRGFGRPDARAIRPLPPQKIEHMRALALARGRVREAALIALLAYAGLRPGEAFALRWDCVGQHVSIVEHGRADGSLKPRPTASGRCRCWRR